MKRIGSMVIIMLAVFGLLIFTGDAFAASAPEITVPTAVDCGKVLKGHSADTTITVKNDGTAPLSITGITNPAAAPFTRNGGTCGTTFPKAIAANESCTVIVTFAPTALGAASSSFTIASDDVGEPSVAVALTGKGVLLTITPDTGTIGTEVEIKGDALGTSKGKVSIGGVAAKVSQWTPAIKATLSKVPALDTPSEVAVYPKDKTAAPVKEAAAFTAKGPDILSVTPAIGTSGSTDEITIAGKYFSTKKGKVTLKKPGVVKSAKVVSWKPEEIKFLVPKKLTAAKDYVVNVSNSLDEDEFGPFEVK
jgi:hypothetical protein